MAAQDFRSTVVGGIQDISALLPLLGTEQCERHVGSALEKGFLYSVVTPISIFGSLGIVRAAFNILVASLRIQKLQFLGAKKLSDGGFNPEGDVAPMIALDRGFRTRFLAESKLEAMLTDEHIENTEDLTVSPDVGIFWWNTKLMIFTLAFSSLGLLPYIALIHNPDLPKDMPLLPSGWGFPIFRVIGSSLCVNAAQLLIQMRILVILKTRLLFATIERLSNTNDSVSRTIGRYQKEHKKWSADLPSEVCIWGLEKWLFLQSKGTNIEAKDKKALEETIGRYKDEVKRHLGSTNKPILLSLHIALSFLLVIGILLTIGGYLGCFYLIQHTTAASTGPVIWLVLEIFLSIIRIIVWAVNPSWDDSKGVVFKLLLATHPPLITCNKPVEEIFEDGTAEVTRADKFLKEIVAYKGPLPLVNWNNIELYYIFTGHSCSTTNDEPEGDIPAVLFVVIYNYMEQSSRLLYRSDDGVFNIYICSLEFANKNTTISVKTNFEYDATKEETHSFTADAKSMEALKAHYIRIVSLFSDQTEKKDLFGKTWAMLHPLEDEPVLSNGPGTWSYRRAVSWLKCLGQMTSTPFSKLIRARKRTSDDFKADSQDVEQGHLDASHQGNTYSQDQEKLKEDQQPKGKERRGENLGQVEQTTGSEAGESHTTGSDDSCSVCQDDNSNCDEDEDEDENENENEDGCDHGDEDSEEEEFDGNRKLLASLTKEDLAYLRHGQLERQWTTFHTCVINWADLFVEQWCKELRRTVSSMKSSESRLWVYQAEMLEIELLVISCRIIMNRFLKATSTKINQYITIKHQGMARDVLHGHISAEASEHSIHAMKKLQRRLSTEFRPSLKAKKTMHAEKMRNWWQTHLQSVQQRLPGVGRKGFRTLRRVSSHILLNQDSGVDEVLASNNGIAAWDSMKSEYKNNVGCWLWHTGLQEWCNSAIYGGEEDCMVLRAKCQKKVDDLFSRMENQRKEFDNVLQHISSIQNGLGDAESRCEIAYWTNESSQERLRLMNREQRYLMVFGKSISTLGGLTNVIRALTRSQPFEFVDFTSDGDPNSLKWSASDILHVIKSVPSITGTFYGDKNLLESECLEIEEALNTNIQAAIQAKQDVCSYSGMEVGAMIDENNIVHQPYLVSNRFDKVSSCTIIFWTHAQQDHIITLRHKFVNPIRSWNIHIVLNGHSLDCTLQTFDDFSSQDFLLPMNLLNAIGVQNEFKIIIARDTPRERGRHDFCLEAVDLPVRAVPASGAAPNL